MKSEIRLLGIDDAPFHFKQDATSIIGIVMRGGRYIEAVLHRQIQVDGTDATQACIQMIQETRYKQQLRAVLIDGVTLGGFNVLDCEQIHIDTNIPIISITRDPPNFETIKKALQQHFSDWKQRYTLIEKGDLISFDPLNRSLYGKCFGLTKEQAKEIIKLSTIHGTIPEPIRVAHLVASGITRGESYGKA